MAWKTARSSATIYAPWSWVGRSVSLCRSLSSRKGLWEVRSALPGNREARVLFCLADGWMVLLHGFIKRTQKTPAADLQLAAKRMKETQR